MKESCKGCCCTFGLAEEKVPHGRGVIHDQASCLARADAVDARMEELAAAATESFEREQEEARQKKLPRGNRRRRGSSRSLSIVGTEA